jgi:hypothetical protein
MLNTLTQRITLDHAKWRSIHLSLVGLNLVLAAAFGFQCLTPMRADNPAGQTVDGNSPSAIQLSDIMQPSLNDFETLAPLIRPGLFKPSSSVQDNPMADKTIERIKSQLKLQCITQISKEIVAYIHIEGLGMKKCKVGDTVNDIFTVINITKANVEITIIGHKVVLSL